MSTSLSINLKKASKVYHEGDIIAGVVVIESPGEVRHEGLTLHAEGAVSLQLSAKNAGLLDAFSNNVKSVSAAAGVTKLFSTIPKVLPCHINLPHIKFLKQSEQESDVAPICLLNTLLELAPGGRVPAGTTEIPFEVPLVPRAGPPGGAAGGALLETYHGVFVNVMYTLKATMKRSFLNKPLNASCQFFVQYKHQVRPPLKPVRCEITPSSVVRPPAAGVGARAGTAAPAPHHMPRFHIYAEIDTTICALDKPITGLIRVDECSVPIKSIELQLVRVETCGGSDGYCRDATEIQNIQVGCGDVVRGRAIPLYMVLPRLFTCPTHAAHAFKIEFELNIAVIFEDDYLVTENFPILLLRCR